MANYQIQAGTSIESFETIGDWTLGGTAGGAQAVNTVIYQEGSGSLKLTSSSDASSNCFSTKTISLDLSNAGIISFDVYVADTDATSTVTLYLSSTTDFAKYFSRAISGLKLGWNRIRIYKNWWSNTSSEDWTNTMVRLRVRTDSTASGGSIVYFDNLLTGTYHRPKVVWTCDDGWATQYTQLYDYAKKFGIRGTLNIIGSYIDQELAGYLTLAQLIEMYNAGWDISNHTYDHTNLTTLATQGEMEEKIKRMKDWLISRGFIRNNCHLQFCYPNGGYNATAVDALKAQGYLTGRTVESQQGLSQAVPPDEPLLLIVRNLGNTTTLTSAIADVDNAISSGCTLVIESHKFVTSATTTTEWDITQMQALIDYIYKKVSGGTIDCIPMSEWYLGLTNSRKRGLFNIL